MLSPLLKILMLSYSILLIISINTQVMIIYNIFCVLGVQVSLSMSIFWSQKLFMVFFIMIFIMGVSYSGYYMKYTNFMMKFLFLKFLFVFSMLFLITGKSLLVLFIGWDGLGVTSFALILFFLNKKSHMSGVMTIMINRMGDGLFLFFILWGLISVSSLNFKYSFISSSVIIMVMFMLMTKSAQYPFSTWLPLAMAAPTPISALVHSSTLVAAGIYLLIDNYEYINMTNMNSFIWVISFLTLLMSGFNSLLEMDFKKLIALSTLNQLSLMFLAVSYGWPILAFFHLMTHSVFKSLLFFNAGVFLHFFFSSQDYRTYSFTMPQPNSLPVFSMLISLISLMGLSFLSGFFSKDFLLSGINMSVYSSSFSILFYFSVGFTIIYSLRLIFMSSLIVSNGSISSMIDKSLSLSITLFILALLAMIVGMYLYMYFSLPIQMSFLMKMFILMLFMYLMSLYKTLWFIMNKMMFKLCDSFGINSSAYSVNFIMSMIMKMKHFLEIKMASMIQNFISYRLNQIMMMNLRKYSIFFMFTSFIFIIFTIYFFMKLLKPIYFNKLKVNW